MASSTREGGLLDRMVGYPRVIHHEEQPGVIIIHVPIWEMILQLL
jgi:hypothetical protein